MTSILYVFEASKAHSLAGLKHSRLARFKTLEKLATFFQNAPAYSEKSFGANSAFTTKSVQSFASFK